MNVPTITELVGPKGYVHGWKFVGTVGAMQLRPGMHVSSKNWRVPDGVHHIQKVETAEYDMGGRANALRITPTKGHHFTVAKHTKFSVHQPQERTPLRPESNVQQLHAEYKAGDHVRVHLSDAEPFNAHIVRHNPPPDGSYLIRDHRGRQHVITEHRIQGHVPEPVSPSRGRGTTTQTLAEEHQRRSAEDAHKALLQARKDARAKYPAGHPLRLRAERAVRKSQRDKRNSPEATRVESAKKASAVSRQERLRTSPEGGHGRSFRQLPAGQDVKMGSLIVTWRQAKQRLKAARGPMAAQSADRTIQRVEAELRAMGAKRTRNGWSL